jgi:hypothetical protein
LTWFSLLLGCRLAKLKLAGFNGVEMVPRSQHGPTAVPAWRLFGATLAGFAIGIQLLLSGLMIGHVAVAADQSEFAVICSHDPGASDPGLPSGPPSHGQCPACACPQWAKLLMAPPASPSFALALPRSELLRVTAGQVPDEHYFHSPYASRAPPQSA